MFMESRLYSEQEEETLAIPDSVLGVSVESSGTSEVTGDGASGGSGVFVDEIGSSFNEELSASATADTADEVQLKSMSGLECDCRVMDGYLQRCK